MLSQTLTAARPILCWYAQHCTSKEGRTAGERMEFVRRRRPRRASPYNSASDYAEQAGSALSDHPAALEGLRVVPLAPGAEGSRGGHKGGVAANSRHLDAAAGMCLRLSQPAVWRCG